MQLLPPCTVHAVRMVYLSLKQVGFDLEKPIIGVRVEAYVNTPIKRPKTVDGVTFMRMYNEAVTNQGTGDALYSDDKIYGTANNLNPYIYPNVDLVRRSVQ